MMTFSFCTQIWVPLFKFPTAQAPRFPNGYPAAAVFEFAMWAILMSGTFCMKRWKAKNADLEPTLSTGDADEASRTELESETVRVDTDKPGGKVGVTAPV